jgi:hypothetical protein
VCWCVGGVLVCWCVGVLVCWCVWVCGCVGVLVCWCVGVLVWCAGVCVCVCVCVLGKLTQWRFVILVQACDARPRRGCGPLRVGPAASRCVLEVVRLYVRSPLWCRHVHTPAARAPRPGGCRPCRVRWLHWRCRRRRQARPCRGPGPPRPPPHGRTPVQMHQACRGPCRSRGGCTWSGTAPLAPSRWGQGLGRGGGWVSARRGWWGRVQAITVPPVRVASPRRCTLSRAHISMWRWRIRRVVPRVAATPPPPGVSGAGGGAGGGRGWGAAPTPLCMTIRPDAPFLRRQAGPPHEPRVVVMYVWGPVGVVGPAAAALCCRPPRRGR